MQSAIHLTQHLIRSIPFFYSKIFEPLKRLHGAVLSYFQKYTAPHHTFCLFGFTASGGLRCALHCLPAYAQMRELKGTKPGGSQESSACCQDCRSSACLQCSSTRRRANCRHARRGQYPTRPLEGR